MLDVFNMTANILLTISSEYYYYPNPKGLCSTSMSIVWICHFLAKAFNIPELFSVNIKQSKAWKWEHSETLLSVRRCSDGVEVDWATDSV